MLHFSLTPAQQIMERTRVSRNLLTKSLPGLQRCIIVHTEILASAVSLGTRTTPHGFILPELLIERLRTNSCKNAGRSRDRQQTGGKRQKKTYVSEK